jgi:hypothetical protein
MKKRGFLHQLSTLQLKVLSTHEEYWKTIKDNEFPIICVIFNEIQNNKFSTITHEQFLEKYRVIEKLNEFKIETPQTELGIYLESLIMEFKNLDYEILKYQEECYTNNIISPNLNLINSLNLYSYEKILNLINCPSYFEKIQFFEDLFYLLGNKLQDYKYKDLTESIINKTVIAASYFYDYYFRFIEYPISLYKIKKVELFDYNENYIFQFIILCDKLREKDKFIINLQNFYYINVLLKQDIFSRKFEERKIDMKKIMWEKKPHDLYIHPQNLAGIIKKYKSDLYKDLLSGKIKYFINKRIK